MSVQEAPPDGIRGPQGVGSCCRRVARWPPKRLRAKRGPTARSTTSLGLQCRDVFSVSGRVGYQPTRPAVRGRESNPLQPGEIPGALPIELPQRDTSRLQPTRGTHRADRPRTRPARRWRDDISRLLEKLHGGVDPPRETPVGVEPTSAGLQPAAGPSGSGVCVKLVNRRVARMFDRLLRCGHVHQVCWARPSACA
jgi:hypothetical protein